VSTAVLFHTFEAGDGWPVGGLVRAPADGGPASPGVLAVPGSRHERDAWTHTAMALVERGCTVMQIDVRGRGASANGVRYSDMGPAERRRVALDVAAAVDELTQAAGVDPSRLGLLVEQDTAADAIEALVGDSRVRGSAILSARHPARTAAAVADLGTPIYGMASIEDREGLRATVDAYLAAPETNSRIDVFRGLGVGITMASVLQFERPDERPIEARLADWMAQILTA
jgi:dienelactone hydrolase